MDNGLTLSSADSDVNEIGILSPLAANPPLYRLLFKDNGLTLSRLTRLLYWRSIAGIA
jgi:hypothetical protein